MDSQRLANPGPNRTLLPQAKVQIQRASVEAWLLHHLAAVPEQALGVFGASLRLRRLADDSAALRPALLMQAALRPQLLFDANPFLSPAAVVALHAGVITWLQLCVLEDRLGRLVALHGAGPDCEPALVQELQVRRTWDVAAHPEWLVFEVGGRRPMEGSAPTHIVWFWHKRVLPL
jgi:hypothetical protein